MTLPSAAKVDGTKAEDEGVRVEADHRAHALALPAIGQGDEARGAPGRGEEGSRCRGFATGQQEPSQRAIALDYSNCYAFAAWSVHGVA